MDRSEFLKRMGLVAGGTLLIGCMGACRREDDDNAAPASLVRDFTLDLTAAENGFLGQDGGSRVVQQVLVVRTAPGQFQAVAATCTHQGGTVQFQAGSGDLRCPTHGARFTLSGSVVSGPAPRPLQRFNTELTGTLLRVFS
jgi:cytochrome b6-f complex iron-sulfur subunit